MKFTEGYWLRREDIKASYVSQGYYVEKIDHGMRMTAPERPIHSRGDAQNITTITIDFIAYALDNILVDARHYEGYQSKEAKFLCQSADAEYDVFITEKEALLTCGHTQVRVNRDNGQYQFEADGKIITSCGFRNQGYIRYQYQPSTMRPEAHYLTENYSPYMVAELSLKPGERVYGLGEQFGAFAKNGQVVECFNEDGGTSSDVAYKNIPFYITNEGYGIFVDHTTPVSFEVASEKVEYVGFSVPGEELRYHFIYGPEMKQVLSHYTDMTGKPALPPAWSFGLWLTTSFNTDYNEKTTSFFIDEMKKRDIPLRVFHFDCFWMKSLKWCDFEWDDQTFTDVKDMLTRYKKEKNMKICVWINPYIAQGTPLFKEGAENKYFLMRADGKGIWQTDNWQPGLAIVDFTNPEATNWYTGKLRQLLDMGVDCFKTDFGERIPIQAVYHNGADPLSMHNYYAYLYNKAVFDLLKEVKGEKEAVVFARSATAGCQQFPVHWGGDCSANYASMAETLRGGLSFAMSGFSFWSHDISGFEQTATPDLYKRWVQFGMLSTHSRLHGSTSYRVPWLFDEEACDVLKFFTKLKCRLMPYLYQMSVNASQTGIPVMRPMILEFQHELGMKDLDMQYMLGDSLLAAPVFNEEGTAAFYLPKGTWTHLLDGSVREGGRWYEEQYDYFSLPLFVRENTLLAVGSQEDLPDYDYCNGTAFHLYALQENCEATTIVTNPNEEYAITVSALRENNRITFTVSDVKEDRFLVLHGISDIATVMGGIVMKHREDGVSIQILEKMVQIDFMYSI